MCKQQRKHRHARIVRLSPNADVACALPIRYPHVNMALAFAQQHDARISQIVDGNPRLLARREALLGREAAAPEARSAFQVSPHPERVLRLDCLRPLRSEPLPDEDPSARWTTTLATFGGTVVVGSFLAPGRRPCRSAKTTAATLTNIGPQIGPQPRWSSSRGNTRRLMSLGLSNIGETGFEPATARPPAGCATRLRYTPLNKPKDVSIDDNLSQAGCSQDPN